MSEEDISVSAERPTPLPKDVRLRQEIAAVQQELNELTVNWVAVTHEGIQQREAYRALSEQENKLYGEYFADLIDRNKHILPDSLKDSRIEYGSSDFSFVVRMIQDHPGDEPTYVELSRSPEYLDPTKKEWLVDPKHLGNGIQVPFMNTKDVVIERGELIPIDSFLNPSGDMNPLELLSKELSNAAVKPFRPAWQAESIPGISSFSNIKTAPLHLPA